MGTEAPTGERVAATLREDITEGRLAPGTPLRDAVLATELGVSRHTLRAALRLLEHDGLVEYQMHKGVVVRALSPADVNEIYRVRRVLEISAVDHSALAPQDGLDELDRCVAAAQAAVAGREWGRVGTASLRFHQALVALLGSASIDRFFASTLAQLRLAFATMHDEARWQTPWIPRDREICDLLLRGERQHAAALLRQYLDESETAVLDVVRAHTATRSPRRRRPSRQKEV
ncbi:GntR family transcriptional regulator [Actinomycetes bacterium KLBMP 9759]